MPGASRAGAAQLGTVAAAAGFVAALGLASVVATGNLVPDSPAEIDVGGLYESRDGKLALLEVNAFAAAGLLALSRRPAAQALAAGGGRRRGGAARATPRRSTARWSAPG